MFWIIFWKIIWRGSGIHRIYLWWPTYSCRLYSMPAELVFRLLSSRQEGEESDLIRLIHAASDDDDENDALLLISLSLYQKKKKKKKKCACLELYFQAHAENDRKVTFLSILFFFLWVSMYMRMFDKTIIVILKMFHWLGWNSIQHIGYCERLQRDSLRHCPVLFFGAARIRRVWEVDFPLCWSIFKGNCYTVSMFC